MMGLSGIPGTQFDLKKYIKKSVRFYDLKNESITQVIFCIIFFLAFVITLINEYTKLDMVYITILNILTLLIKYLCEALYQLAYIKELKGKKYSFRSCLNQVLKQSLKIIIASMFYFAAIIAGLFLLIVPGVIVYIMFMFNTCFIIDRKKRVMHSFVLSREITNGKKTPIFIILIIFYFIFYIPVFIAASIAYSSGGFLILAFVLTFFLSIIDLMQKRLIVLIYIDLLYKKIGR